MDVTAILAAMVAVIVIILIMIGVTRVWYNKTTSWSTFSASSANFDWPQWSSTSSKGASALRFRNCKFTVVLGDGTTTKTKDVTNTLNAMAMQQQTPILSSGSSGSSSPAPTTGPMFQQSMSLVRPLNPFSFTITGFNDPTMFSDPAVINKYPWCITYCNDGTKAAKPALVTLTGEFRTL